jgi:predicted DNA-binding transcriptional regulator AlpA
MTTTKTVPPTDQAWTTTDVAEFLRVSVRHVYNLRTTDATFPQPVPVGRALLAVGRGAGVAEARRRRRHPVGRQPLHPEGGRPCP